MFKFLYGWRERLCLRAAVGQALHDSREREWTCSSRIGLLSSIFHAAELVFFFFVSLPFQQLFSSLNRLFFLVECNCLFCIFNTLACRMWTIRWSSALPKASCRLSNSTELKSPTVPSSSKNWVAILIPTWTHIWLRNSATLLMLPSLCWKTTTTGNYLYPFFFAGLSHFLRNVIVESIICETRNNALIGDLEQYWLVDSRRVGSAWLSWSIIRACQHSSVPIWQLFPSLSFSYWQLKKLILASRRKIVQIYKQVEETKVEETSR